MLTRSSKSTVKHQPDTVSKTDDWHERAQCRDYKFKRDDKGEVFNPWFPKSGKPEDVTSEGMKICGACPVALDCLIWALDKGELKDGIYGGTTPSQRRAMLKKKKAA